MEDTHLVMNQISTYSLLLFFADNQNILNFNIYVLCERTYISVRIYIHPDQLEKRIKNYEKERTAY